MNKFHTLLLAFACSAVALPVLAAQNAIPSCYEANKMKNPEPIPEREIFVLIDQTTVLDDNLKQLVRNNVAPFASHGNAFLIARFSAFSQGRYLDVLNAGKIEAVIPEQDRGAISVKLLKTFDACMQGQQMYAARMMAGAINKAMQESSDSLAQSDVMSSLKEFSTRVRESNAKDKIVFVVSDMLENSSISSFYMKKGVRVIDPAKEMAIAEKNDQIGDFGGARVFILGAGVIPEVKGAKSYRDPKTMNALKSFWTGYFEKSNAALEQFGMPALLSPVK